MNAEPNIDKRLGRFDPTARLDAEDAKYDKQFKGRLESKPLPGRQVKTIRRGE
jgi:hypothetical protein